MLQNAFKIKKPRLKIFFKVMNITPLKRGFIRLFGRQYFEFENWRIVGLENSISDVTNMLIHIYRKGYVFRKTSILLTGNPTIGIFPFVLLNA